MLKLISTNFFHRFQYQKCSYSQCGEDLIIRFIFDNIIKLKEPTYIDIGAHHPFDLNNTFIFYLNGSRGINIDPNEKSIELFNKYRNKDINLRIGVSDKQGLIDFFRFKYSTYNTFDPIEAEKHKDALIDVQKVEVDTIQNLILNFANGQFPDFLSLDVEGLDLKILKNINLKSNGPKVICVETIINNKNTSIKNLELINFLQENDYILHSDTFINSIFIKKIYLS